MNNTRALTTTFDYKTTDPGIWGPYFWFVCHSYAYHYSTVPSAVEKSIASNFIKSLPFMIPCAECSRHAFAFVKSYYKKLDIITNSPKNLQIFFNAFHNEVNVRLGKPEYIEPQPTPPPPVPLSEYITKK